MLRYKGPKDFEGFFEGLPPVTDPQSLAAMLANVVAGLLMGAERCGVLSTSGAQTHPWPEMLW